MIGSGMLPGLQKELNEELQKAHIAYQCRMYPYEITSTLQIKYLYETTYTQLLTQYQGHQLLNQLKNVGFSKLLEPIYVFSVRIDPEGVEWTIFHHMDEIAKFMTNLGKEIEMMMKYKSRMSETSGVIKKIHEQLVGKKTYTREEANKCMQLLNLLANHHYLRKSIRFLIFVQHCVPINLWNLHVIQQIQLYKKKNFLQKIFSDEQVVDYFLTVTVDGILISTKNLLETKIDKMIPFTNQFSFDTKLDSDNGLIFELSSCIHEVMSVDVEDNYMAGINLFVGLKQALKESDLFDPHRFNSFSRARIDCEAKLYNDGQWYFSDLCDALKMARFQVCITDWWMTPYFLLKRPDNIERTHNRLDGIFKELSQRGVRIFIILFRQPLNALCNDSQDAQFYLESLGRNIRVRRHPIVPQLWSHHEKSVIIDQKVGFMGGLDICYGRWDNPEHSLTNKNDNWNGADYTNERIRSFVPGTTKNILSSPVDREYEPRMPWHDIGIRLKGDAVIDLLRHFIQYWYFVENEKVKDPYSHLSSIKKRFNRSANYQEPDWTDERNNPANTEKSVSQSLALCGKRTSLFIVGTERRLPELLIEVRAGNKEGDKKLQICRSASPWSIGAKQTEHSIHNAYQQLISESENFIYIQNQFFMGQENKIVESLAKRIERAHYNRENFKVIVVMPLLPGFEGDITDRKNTIPLRVQVHNQYQSINRGKNSLHARLSSLPNFNINNYIFFFGLRGHAVLNKKPVTEIIYVHSKLMIVDDKRAIIGSANINDRSLLGDRDSQLAIVIQEENGMNLLDNRPRRKDIFQFRCRIFNEHFGLAPEETERINDINIWSKIIANAKNNTLIYRKVFGCYPDNNITVAQEIDEQVFESNPNEYFELMPRIVGHAVEMPLDFMKDECLELERGDKQGLFGEKTFL